MRSFRLLTALAVVAYASVSLADNLPPAPKSSESSAAVTVKAVVAAPTTCDVAPMPPTFQVTAPKAEAKPVCKCQQCEAAKKHKKALEKVADELVRKPLYGMEKAAHDAQTKRLDKENKRLNHEAQELGSELTKFSEKVQQTPANNFRAKLKLAKEERRYDREVNKLAVRRARWAMKVHENAQAETRLDEKHAKLYVD